MSERPEDTDLKVGDVAQETGLSVDTLRYYERQGLLVGTIELNPAGQRVYRDVDVDWLTICTRLRQSGIAVPTLVRYAELVRAGSGNERERLAVLREQRASVQDAARGLAEALELIDTKITAYESATDDAGPTPPAVASPAPPSVPEQKLLGEIDPNRGSLTLRRRLPAIGREVWVAISTEPHLAEWLGRVADGVPGPDATFAMWHDSSTRSQHNVLTWEPGRTLSFTWDFPEEGTSTVAFDIDDAGDDATLLTLRHSGLVDPARYAAGWHRHLDYLAAHLTGDELPAGWFWDGYDDLVARYATTARD